MKTNEQLIQKFLDSSEVKTYNPLSFLIDPAERTNIPNVYKNPQCPYNFNPNKKLIINIFGPSGAGKDTITRLPDSSIADITIATSRSQRETESAEAYKWMRQKRTNESDEEYSNHLIQEYHLLSHAVENGILYGVPQEGIDAVSDANVITIRMSARSINELRHNLQDQYNIVSLMVVPDSFESLIPSILKRGNVEKRLAEAVENMKLGKQYANYFLLNRHINGTEDDLQNAIQQGRDSFANLIKTIRTQ